MAAPKNDQHIQAPKPEQSLVAGAAKISGRAIEKQQTSIRVNDALIDKVVDYSEKGSGRNVDMGRPERDDDRQLVAEQQARNSAERGLHSYFFR